MRSQITKITLFRTKANAQHALIRSSESRTRKIGRLASLKIKVGRITALRRTWSRKTFRRDRSRELRACLSPLSLSFHRTAIDIRLPSLSVHLLGVGRGRWRSGRIFRQEGPYRRLIYDRRKPRPRGYRYRALGLRRRRRRSPLVFYHIFSPLPLPPAPDLPEVDATSEYLRIFISPI